MRKTIFTLALFLSAFTVNAFAQFEGKITYTMYETDDNGQREDEESFTTFITPQRIYLQGEESFDVSSMFKTSGMLIRLDKKDFVFFMDDNTAMSISKAGITSFINMFGGANADRDETDDIKKDFTFKNTGETKSIAGYTASKFVFQSKKEDDKGIIWMTRDIQVNWGMLAEPWGDSVSFLTGKELPTNLVLHKGWIPLEGTFYDDGKLSGGFLAKVDATDVQKEWVTVGPKITVTSLSEYLFQHMRQQQ